MAVFNLPGYTGPVLQKSQETNNVGRSSPGHLTGVIFQKSPEAYNLWNSVTSGFVLKRTVMTQFTGGIYSGPFKFNKLGVLPLLSKPDRVIGSVALTHAFDGPPYLDEGSQDGAGISGGISLY